jgi:hypothetical protein
VDLDEILYYGNDIKDDLDIGRVNMKEISNPAKSVDDYVFCTSPRTLSVASHPYLKEKFRKVQGLLNFG